MSGEELPAGWAAVTLGAVTLAKVLQCEPEGETFIYVDIGGVDRVTKSIKSTGTLASADAPSRARQLLRAGDVLVSTVRPNLNAVARVPIALDGAIASTGFDVLRATAAAESGFLFYFVQSPKFVDSMVACVQGALYPAVRSVDVRSVELPLPPLPEQRRIVAKLDELRARSQKAREALDEVPALLEKLKQSVLAAAFRGDLTAEWRAAQAPGSVEPASVLLERIRAERRARWEQANPKKKYEEPEPVDTDGLPELPEGWCWVGISELLSPIRAGLRTGPFGTLLQKSDFRNAGTPVIGIENIGPMAFLKGNKVFIETSKADDLRDYDVQPGDILISRSGTVGEVCVAPPGVAPARFSTNIIRVVLDQRSIAPSYFGYMFVGCAAVLRQVNDLCSGSSRDFLNQTILSRMAYPIAPRLEQDAIVSRIGRLSSTWNSAAATLAGLLANLNSLDQAILAKAFRGELVPQDPNDEPADQLLARIQAEAAAPQAKRAGPGRPRRGGA